MTERDILQEGLFDNLKPLMCDTYSAVKYTTGQLNGLRGSYQSMPGSTQLGQHLGAPLVSHEVGVLQMSCLHKERAARARTRTRTAMPPTSSGRHPFEIGRTEKMALSDGKRGRGRSEIKSAERGATTKFETCDKSDSFSGAKRTRKNR